MNYDVVIVGGGPAGGSAAHALAERGARVVLLERARVPRYKTCGGGVLARVRPWLPRDLRFEPERALASAEWNLPEAGLRVAVSRPDPIVYMTMRDRFDHEWLRVAEAAGADIRTGCSFLGFDVDGNGLVVRSDRGSIRARYLVGADGANGRVARAGGWPNRPAGTPALECEVEVNHAVLDRFAGTARFDIGVPAGGYAWVFPKRSHLSVGILRATRGPGRLGEWLDAYLRQLGIERPAESRVHGHVIPVDPRPDGFSRGPVLLTGDAAGLADPLLGEGITAAIRSGRLAAESVLAGGSDAASAGRSYDRALRREMLPELRSARFLAAVLYRWPRARNRLLRAFGGPFSEALAEVIAGRTTYRELLSSPGNYWKLLLARGRRRSDGAPPGRAG
jgi:geranylgeranyl reductase family protein